MSRKPPSWGGEFEGNFPQVCAGQGIPGRRNSRCKDLAAGLRMVRRGGVHRDDPSCGSVLESFFCVWGRVVPFLFSVQSNHDPCSVHRKVSL